MFSLELCGNFVTDYRTIIIKNKLRKVMTNILNHSEIEKLRGDFPILSQKIYNNDLIYFDNGATTQKPQQVIDAIVEYYTSYNSNVHRGVHYLSQRATDAEEHARRTVQQFINADSPDEVIFTKGTTDSINLLAFSFGQLAIQEHDEIIISRMEHHANIVPWQECAKRHNAVLKVIDFDKDGVLDMNQFRSLITHRTKIIAVTWVSNTLGTINPVADIISIAHHHNIPVMLDAAQAVQHIPVDVQQLDVDFLVFSGHKIYAPTGIGVLYGKRKWLEQMPPYQTGGSMIKTVKVDTTTFGDVPFRFEAGTPHVEGIIGLGRAIEYVNKAGIAAIAAYEHDLITYAKEQLGKIDRVNILGASQPKAGALSLVIDGIHPFDAGELLDKKGIAVRTGHHCCQPIMDYYGIPGTLRVSFALYNNRAEVDVLAHTLERVIGMLV